MYEQRYEGIYPTSAPFAFRMLTCLTSVAGTLSEPDFNEWFSFPNPNRALRRFKRVAFRVYMQMHLKKTLMERVKGRSYQVRIRFIRRVRHRLCSAWKSASAYALYREVVAHGFSREAFTYWWNELRSHERLLFVYAWAHQIKQSNLKLWTDSLAEDAGIYVQISGGDTTYIRVF